MTPRDRAAHPLRFNDPAAFERLRDVLARAEFRDRCIIEALGTNDLRALAKEDDSRLLQRTSGGRALDTLIRLLLMGMPLDAEVVRRAIAPMTVAEWLDAGLLAPHSEGVRAAVQVLPFQGLLLVTDRPSHRGEQPAPNFVMGIGTSSMTLAACTVRRPSARTLDLGTGCGFLAFLAAPHSERVVATDRNPRAVNFAAFNARLNGLDGIEAREGDLFEPVAGEQFDLIVSNPPFVVSPESGHIYRDSDLPGDQISETITRQAPAFLREGGYCQMIFNWVHYAGQDWKERLAAWVEGSGCDAWLMRSNTRDADAYAAKWVAETGGEDPGHPGRRFEGWMAYYEQLGIEAVSTGVLSLRRRTGGPPNWFRADDGAETLVGSAGESIARGFELQDFLNANPGDEALMARRLRVSPDVRLHQRLEPSPEGWRPVELQLKLERGLAYVGNVDTFVANLLGQCDGQQPLGDVLRGLAPSVDEDLDSIAPACLAVVRGLIERGFLLPADDATQPQGAS